MVVNRIAVIGAGDLGRGIAYAAALGGFETTLEDVRPEALERAMDWLQSRIEEGVERGAVSAEDARRALGRVRTAGRVEEAADADLVIEAGPEEMELKIELFGMLDKFARAETILATTSHTLSIADMAAVTQRPEHCIGMRFLDPATEGERLELVRTADTSEATLAACRNVGRRMGKDVVMHDESPGDPERPDSGSR
jgi:3-hydroxybutyryl-CoA dehydrogenase